MEVYLLCSITYYALVVNLQKRSQKSKLWCEFNSFLYLLYRYVCNYLIAYADV